MKSVIIITLIFLVLSIGITPAMSFDFIPVAEGYGGGDKPDPRVCGDKLCSEIPGGRTAWEDKNKQPLPPYELDLTEESLGDQTSGKFVSMSPKKQFLNGIESKNAICYEGLELILKSSSNSYACVEPKSVIKLVERGWGIDPPQKIRLNDMRCWSGGGEWRKYYFDVTIINLDENKSIDTNDLLVYVDGEEILENRIRNFQNEIKPGSKISVGINYEEGYFFDHVVDFRELRVIGPSNTAIDVWPC